MKKLLIKYLPVGLSLLYFISCNSDGIKRNNTHPEVTGASIEKGKALATKYCQSCHLLPDPSWSDTKSWSDGILPAMGPRLGIFQHQLKQYPSSISDPNLTRGFYPAKPIVTPEEWQSILDYYVATSPDTILPDQHRVHPISNQLKQFSIVPTEFTYANPAVSFVKIDTTHPEQPLIISDARKKIIYRFDKQLAVIDSIRTNGPIVDIEMNGPQWTACNIGVLNPNNGKFGQGNRISLTAKGKMVKDSLVLFNELRRPVQVTATDFNNDGKSDYLVCEFGFMEGSLSWMEGTADGKFIPHVIRQFPGAIKAYLQDYNHDGLMDIWVLFAQGEEGIFLFTNKGKGNFAQEEVLRFPPIYGSSYFELDDFNKDGYPDILYTCGDNADYSPVLKPFHGLYIFLNDGHNHFKQAYFFPMNGCYKAIANDYDHDGDLDIAAISYFADYVRQPEESFVYLQNNGNYDFSPYSLPGAQRGRWLTMDAGDIDGDGFKDLILGNFAFAPTFIHAKNDWRKEGPLLVLKNIGEAASHKLQAARLKE